MPFDQKEFLKGKRSLGRKPEVKNLFTKYKAFAFSPSLDRTPFESLVRAIAHQQLHGKAAETILGRLIRLFPGTDFPSPKDLQNASSEDLRACGFSQSKIKSLKDIAEKTLSGVVPSSKEITGLSNDEIIERLTEIYGVGQWTVEMLLIFQLGRLDVWPVDDFGVRKGYQLWLKKRKMPTAKDLKKVGRKWHPYQTILALYLWQEANNAKDSAKTVQKDKRAKKKKTGSSS